jgi:hypothetical protein
MQDMFRIAGIHFAATSARLLGWIHQNAFYDEAMMIWEDEMCWGFEIEASSMVQEFSDWTPSLSGTMFATSPHEFETGQGLAPRINEWIEPGDTEDIPHAMLYVFEHTLLYDCKAEFYTDEKQFRLRLSGKCDVYFDEMYGENLSIEVDLPLQFQGILCGRQPEVECRAELAQYLNNDDFDYVETEDGVSMLVPRVA